jgi:hypothetical protein
VYQVELCTVDGLVKESTQCAPNGYYFIPVYDKVSLCFLFTLVLDYLLCVLILFTHTILLQVGAKVKGHYSLLSQNMLCFGYCQHDALFKFLSSISFLIFQLNF